MIIHEVLLTVGTILGAVVGGSVYEQLSFSRVLLVIGTAAIILVMVELLVAFFIERTRITGK
jgi:DHA1 family multidrug resistance protein-like MFS transporter/DHA1 family quinolone resistance protein-like MFS transporter